MKLQDNTELTNEIMRKLDSSIYDDIKPYIGNSWQENHVIEFKSKDLLLNAIKEDKEREKGEPREEKKKAINKIIKVLCSFANTYGGILLIGIEDSREIKLFSKKEIEQLEDFFKSVESYIDNQLKYTHTSFLEKKMFLLMMENSYCLYCKKSTEISCSLL